MSQAPFVGRKYELERLNDLFYKKTASLVVINGRRRIGKSRLIEEFAKNKTFYHFSGLAPDRGVTAQDQRNEFSAQLARQTNFPEMQSDDWSKLFHLLGEKINQGKIVVLFDEITWMAHGDHTFLSKLKNAWEINYKKNPKLIFIICGSVSAWIEKNILSSTGYFGRVSLHLTLTELPLSSCSQLLDVLAFKRSSLEKLLLLSLTGCIPWYIEQVNPHYSAEKNISRLCFEPSSLLLPEFKYIFHDLFGRRSEIYEKIVKLLVNGPIDYQSLSEKLQYSTSSSLTNYLQELIICGYIKKYNTWDFKTGVSSNLGRFRLSDNFLRFYFKFMLPKISTIKEGRLTDLHVSTLPGWWGMIGLQIENLILNNSQLILEALSINPLEIVAEGPFFQRTTKRAAGCQFDYLIQTKLNTLYACEIKFSQKKLNSSVVKEMKEKIKKLSAPKRFVVLPVLIHCNEVSDEVEDADYFYKIINFSQFLETS